MRDLEKYYCEYLFLGSPEKTFRELLRFVLKKRKRPIVFTEKAPFMARLFGLANFRVCRGLNRDGIVMGLLEHYVSRCEARIITLIATRKFDGFVKRNRGWLEARFLIRNSEEIYR